MRFVSILVALAGLVAVMASPANAGPVEFCDGFEAGYVAGYKREKNTPVPPIPHPCPVQPVKRLGDPQSDFEYGYAIGYGKGTAAAN